MVGSCPQATEATLQGVGQRLALIQVHRSGNRNGQGSHGDACAGHALVDVDVVGQSVGRNQVSERNETSHKGNGSQYHQRESHAQRTFVRCMFSMKFLVLFTPEDAEVEAEHIEGCHGGDNRHNPSHGRAELEAGCQNLVLREEARERRDACNGQAGDEERPVRDGHILAQTSHSRHLVAVDGMDDAARAEEEQGLEHGVGEEVEHAGHVTQASFVRVGRGTYAESHHHEADLRNGGEGQHTLDVALHAGYRCRIESGEGTHVGHDVKRLGRIGDEQREHAGHQIDTRYHHSSGMDEGTDRRRTLHGVGQPDVQGEHGTLACTADEHQPQGQRKHGTTFGQSHLSGGECIGACIVTIHQDTDEEAQVGEARHDERFLRSGDGGRFGIIESDEQIGRYTHQLPEEVHLEDVRGYHQAQHGHGEERQKGIVALETPLTLHVAEGVDVYHQADGRDDDEHHYRDGVEQDTHVNAQVLAERQPVEVVGH